MTVMTIGKVARISGVKIPTVRYYEEIGLLAKAARTDGGRRSYSNADLERLNFVRHARDLGFSMDDIRALIAMTASPQASCDAADSIARRNLQTIELKITALTTLKHELQRMVETCSKGSIAECRVLQVLSDHRQCAVHTHVRT